MISRQFLSAFDLDRTLMRGNSSLQLCLYLTSRKKLSKKALYHSLFCYALHRMGYLTLNELHERIFHRWLLGYSLDMLREEVKSFALQLRESHFYPPAMAHLRHAKERGHLTLLLSNSPQFLVGELAELLGFDAVYASSYAEDSERRLSAISSVVTGIEKADILKKYAHKFGICKENIVAYSDSYLDLPFLQAAGRGVAVNPDRRLRAFSKKAHWPIL